MADVTGPISSMPGSIHKLPAGMQCDDCDEPAICRVQGETDSMGCEMMDLCQSCYDKMKASGNEEPSWCDHCNAPSDDVRPMRDSDEGSTGRIYYLCPSHRKSLRDYHSEE